MKSQRNHFLRNALSLALLTAALGSGISTYAAGTDTATTQPGKAIQQTERVVSDSWITTKVKSKLLANSGTKAFKVSVKTKHGAVVLNGKLPTQDAVDQVKQIAEKVKGVRSVDTSGIKIEAQS